jgi:type II secretory pathway predicted ATPase ExeA
MFKQFFGLKYNPFTKEIPPEHLFSSAYLKELDSRLKYLQEVRGIGLLAGESGAGKSAALGRYAANLNPALFKVCYFALSTVTVLEFYQGLAMTLGEEPKHKKVALFHQIQQAIYSLYYDRRITPVIILDEIQLASNKVLEDLRLLFNFQMDSKNPFVLILSGQPLIRNKLALNVNNPLRQRLAVHYFLHGLKEEELPFYCQSRFKLAGLSEEIITPAAYGAIHSITNGLPRLVNNLITACLLCACAKRQKQIDEEVVYQAQQELNL